MTIDFSSFDFETINEPAPEEQAYRDITPGKHGETILVQVHELYEHGDSGFGVQVKDAADPEATAYLNLFKRHMHVVSVNGQPMNQRALKLFEGMKAQNKSFALQWKYVARLDSVVLSLPKSWITRKV